MTLVSLSDYRLTVSFRMSKSGRKVATIRILGDGEIKWRRISAPADIDDAELYRLAIRAGKKYCRGKVAYQGFLPVV